MPPVMIRKKFGHTASAVKGSNKITACSKVDLSFVENGSFIMLNGDEVFYKVATKNKFIYEQEAEVSDESLTIASNAGTMLNIDDDISLAYKDYEVSEVQVENGGKGYQEGDVINPQGGACKYNSIDEIDIPAQLEVEEVDSDGAILSLKIVNSGIYSVPPEDDCNAMSGAGSGASLKVATRLLNTSSIETRSISSIELSDDKTVIGLNHPLSPRMQSVSLKVEKWQLTISTEYTGESKFNVGYDIIKDFTPNYNLPLIKSDITASHMVYNEAMAIIDQRIKDIENKLN